MGTVKTRSPSEVVKLLLERMNQRDPAFLTELVADDVDEYWPVVGRLQGVDAVRDHFAAVFAAMPDFKIELERMAADGETVFVHWHMKGHFTGAPFYGLVATGHEIELRGTDYFTIHDGKVTRNFIAYDGMSFAVQAGILPARGTRMDHLITHLTNVRTKTMRLIHR